MEYTSFSFLKNFLFLGDKNPIMAISEKNKM